MRVLHLHPGPDTGGQSAGGRAILEAAGHEVRVLVRSCHPFGYPASEHWDHPSFQTVAGAWEWADVVVIHNDARDFAVLAATRPKPLIVHHHGSRFRNYPDQQYGQAARLGAVQVVSTVDLLTSVPPGGTAAWLPQNVDLARMAEVRARCHVPSDGPLRVAHMPTNRAIKGTAYVMGAARRLEGLVELVMPRHTVPWGRCLELKATADVYADQFTLGYGNNAIEAWAMGMPVVAGAEPAILERMRREYGGPPPFMATDGHQLRGALAEMAASADLRAEWAGRGAEHVARFHAPGPWLARMEELLGMAIERFGARVSAA